MRAEWPAAAQDAPHSGVSEWQSQRARHRQTPASSAPPRPPSVPLCARSDLVRSLQDDGASAAMVALRINATGHLDDGRGRYLRRRKHDDNPIGRTGLRRPLLVVAAPGTHKTSSRGRSREYPSGAVIHAGVTPRRRWTRFESVAWVSIATRALQMRPMKRVDVGCVHALRFGRAYAQVVQLRLGHRRPPGAGVGAGVVHA